jgi:hypothetical protein
VDCRFVLQLFQPASYLFVAHYDSTASHPIMSGGVLVLSCGVEQCLLAGIQLPAHWGSVCGTDGEV